MPRRSIEMPSVASWLLAAALPLGWASAPASEAIGVKDLLVEMVDFENLARRPEPSFKKATATSYSRESHKGGDAWFDNSDVGQYVRTETNAGRKEHVLADLKGPGAVARFWSANPTRRNITRFYFDGESQPRIEVPLEDLFGGKTRPFGPEFSYVSGTGGNLYYPLPYSASLRITIEEKERPIHLYYEIDYRTYASGTAVETLNPPDAGSWEDVQLRVAQVLARPRSAPLHLPRPRVKSAQSSSKTRQRSVSSDPPGLFAASRMRTQPKRWGVRVEQRNRMSARWISLRPYARRK